jgi:hypothetical protein
MILFIQVMSMNDESFKVLVLVVVAILVISLLMNAFFAADLQSFSSPPVRVTGYFTEKGEPLPGYYIGTELPAAQGCNAEDGRACSEK